MKAVSFLKNKMLFSPIENKSTLKPQGRTSGRSQTATLMLTSLVDAFSILVIFLMMNSATEQSDIQAEKVVLPKASEAQVTLKTAVVKMSGNKYFVNDAEVTKNQLASALGQIHESLKQAQSTTMDSLVIVADRDVDYAALNPIIVAGSRVGFNEFKFAVQRVGESTKQAQR